MATDGQVFIGYVDMGMDLPIEDISINRGEVNRDTVFNEYIFWWEGTIVHHMYMVCCKLTDPAQDYSIPDLFLLNSFLQSGQQISMLFHSYNNNTLKLALGGYYFRDRWILGITNATRTNG